MEDLIQRDQIAELIKIGKLKSGVVASLMMQALSFNSINELYARHAEKEALPFIDAILNDLGVQFQFDETELKNIPKTGAFISVSNHPYGGIEGLMLLKLLLLVRPEANLMANFLLKNIKPIEKYVVPVNPFDKASYFSNLKGIKLCLEHLKEGKPLGVFPAGEVSTFQKGDKRVTDREWQAGVMKLIEKAEVPVVPIYFHGKNSVIFHLLGMVHPILQTARLPGEMLNKNKKAIKVRIGKAISVKDQKEFSGVAQLGRFLRARTYSLGSALEVKKFFRPSLRSLKKPAQLIESVDKSILANEIESIRPQCFVHHQKEFEVFIAPSDKIPNILTEIGRLREETFRKVGEGTNRSIDLDEFDLYYHHLFLWDKENQSIAGAYRLGKGQEIMDMYGKKGFYLQSLFRFKKSMTPILAQSVELGRSFIPEEYQRKMLPLFLLWKGILYFLLTNREYRYLIGPVSISNQFSKLSKSLIIQFIKRNYWRADLAQYVKPKKKFRPKWKGIDAMALLEKSGNNIKALDQSVQDIEPEHFNVPVLLKKYIKQNAKIIGFNVDPKFGHALDGLILLDLKDVPKETIDDLKKDFDIKLKGLDL